MTLRSGPPESDIKANSNEKTIQGAVVSNDENQSLSVSDALTVHVGVPNVSNTFPSSLTQTADTDDSGDLDGGYEDGSYCENEGSGEELEPEWDGGTPRAKITAFQAGEQTVKSTKTDEEKEAERTKKSKQDSKAEPKKINAPATGKSGKT